MTDKAKAENFNIYLRILSYLRPYYRYIVLVLFLNLFYTVFNTMSVWIVAPFISTLFESEQAVIEQPIEQSSEVREEPSSLNLNEWLKSRTGKWIRRGNRIEALKVLCVLIFLTFFLKNAFAFWEFYHVSFVEQKVIKDLREQVYEHILWQPLNFFEKYQTGNLMSRVTNDIQALNVAVNRSFTKIIRDPLVILIFLAILFSISWQLTLVALVVIPISGILIRKIGQSLKRKSRRVQERIADMTTILQEAITGVKIIKAFSMEHYENEKFRNKITEHFNAALRQVRLNRLSSPLSETMGVGIMVVVLWVGGQLVLSHQLITSEDFIRFIIILFSIMAPIKSLGELNNNIQISLASGARVFEILDTPISLSEKPSAINKKGFEKDIRFENVSFEYEGNGSWMLHGIDLLVKKNQKVALVGSSGAGKTTLVNLLPRFYDVKGGAVRIDGIDVRDMSLSSLRKLMGIVTQDIILFNDTVANNIAYGMNDYSMDEIKKAARLANACEFIEQMPQGFQSIIGERGMRLSGGQRQRISIARAILKNPPIMIFDEATSSLDSESELLIQRAIENLITDRTVLVIAHRLFSIINSDKIIVLGNGTILDEGSHDELLDRSSYYRQIYKLQFATST